MMVERCRRPSGPSLAESAGSPLILPSSVRYILIIGHQNGWSIRYDRARNPAGVRLWRSGGLRLPSAARESRWLPNTVGRGADSAQRPVSRLGGEGFSEQPRRKRQRESVDGPSRAPASAQSARCRDASVSPCHSCGTGWRSICSGWTGSHDGRSSLGAHPRRTDGRRKLGIERVEGASEERSTAPAGGTCSTVMGVGTRPLSATEPGTVPHADRARQAPAHTHRDIPLSSENPAPARAGQPVPPSRVRIPCVAGDHTQRMERHQGGTATMTNSVPSAAR